MPLLVSPHLIMQQLPNLSFLTTDLSFILNITAKFHFFSIKTDKITWKTKKNRHFSKMAKARLMLMSSKFVMTPNLFFFPVMECGYHEQLWKSQLRMR